MQTLSTNQGGAILVIPVTVVTINKRAHRPQRAQKEMAAGVRGNQIEVRLLFGTN